MDIRYSKIIVVVFITMLYNSGLPILNFVAFIYFIILYNIEKWWLLNVCRIPNNFDDSL